MSTAVLSIGANQGDRLAALTAVVAALGRCAASGVYETAPWGPVPQPDYLNAVLIADDDGRDAADWLTFAQERERAAGRVRAERWGPRTLDVDIIQVVAAGHPVTSADPALTLPHPRAAERAFVLVPWLDLEPDAVLGRTPVRDLVAALPPTERDGVRRTEYTLEVSHR